AWCPRRAVQAHPDADEPHLGEALIRVREVTPAAQLERDPGRSEELRGRAPGGLRAEDRRHPPPGPERHGRSPPLDRPDEARVREPTVRKPGGLDAQLELRRPGAALGT